MSGSWSSGVSAVPRQAVQGTHITGFPSALADRGVVRARLRLNDTMSFAVRLAFQRTRGLADGAAEFEVADEHVGFVGGKDA